MGCKESALRAVNGALQLNAQLSEQLREKDAQLKEKDAQLQEKETLLAQRDHYIATCLSLSFSMERIELADRPVGVVGEELSKFVEEIEKAAFERRDSNQNNESKDERGVVMVRAPPRHGKSLLLDQIFRGAHDTAVIAITFNSSTSLTRPEELGKDPHAGEWQLVTRIFMRLFRCMDRSPLMVMGSLQERYQSAGHVWHMLLEFIRRYPAVKRVLIAIDEASNMIDFMTQEQTHALRTFLDHNFLTVSSSSPQVGVVMTAIHPENG